jgi:hypothetical protein
MLSPTICRYFAPPTSHRPFRLPTYSTSLNLHTRTRPRRSSTLPFCYSFGHYLLNLMLHLDFAFVLPTYGIDPYSNKRKNDLHLKRVLTITGQIESRKQSLTRSSWKRLQLCRRRGFPSGRHRSSGSLSTPRTVLVSGIAGALDFQIYHCRWQIQVWILHWQRRLDKNWRRCCQLPKRAAHSIHLYGN